MCQTHQPDARHQATKDQGERAMSGMIGGPDGERVIRWIEESPRVFDAVRRMLQEYDQVREAAQAARAERDRLQEQCAALREQVRQLHVELTRLQKERAEAAQWCATMIREAAARFPLASPPA
jgi:hypothetical protein